MLLNGLAGPGSDLDDGLNPQGRYALGDIGGCPPPRELSNCSSPALMPDLEYITGTSRQRSGRVR